MHVPVIAPGGLHNDELDLRLVQHLAKAAAAAGVGVTIIGGATIITVNIVVATVSSNGPASPSRLATRTAAAV